MNTAAFAGVAAYLLSMAAIAPEPVSLAVGVTTIVDVQQHYTIIDKIGTSYTGGPVLNLSEWEVNLEGVTDIQLAFNAEGVLDVATVKADKLHLEEVLNGLKSQLQISTDESSLGFENVTFLSGSTEVVVESHPLDTQFTVNYISADFKRARTQAQKQYA
ncbi:hypothetical protein IQK56_13000 [Pseudomonas sp. MAFF 301449]|jgi:hypothetical protein|uniref:Partitioning protein n=2 Tax=Pseudomonas TaxID=286 RepID=A0A2S3WK14_PSEPU|nr:MULTISPECIES: hypothetical protein [Pseudomonas]ERT15920.1 partitioning protein [Pseudomonas putida SJ3]MBT9570169.1 hypothetical protein [Pseudomonas umsongensis]OHC63840.1 MAG: partitioning protein [Pseudomonadales bacterium RIFCSPLOWO2_02_FULL_63_210]MBE8591778.1 hypothetical protein [Pseudomonas cyclaminis]MBE8599838.1 hypothetical protein [Pseudomonas cyclaminis]